MNTVCKICREIKGDVALKFICNEYKEPEPPFAQKQMVTLTLLMCSSCY